MPRQRVGTVWKDMAKGPDGEKRWTGRWWVQITLADGTRSKPRLLGPEIHTIERAREVALAWSQKAERDGSVRTRPAAAPLAAEGETADRWFARRFAEQQARGLTSVDDMRGRWRKWCSGRLGRLAMTAITRDDIEGLVEDLDGCVRLGALSAKTANNAYGVVTAGFDEACNAKTRDLRVLSANPCVGVRGPYAGVTKAKVYLYPCEFLKLVMCESVPVRWRRIYALATYTYTRASELLALEWTDVELDSGVIRITKALDKKGRVKPTKTKETRSVPIEPNLWPLLSAMHREAGGVGRVVTLPRKKMADELRMHLLRAGVDRPALHARTATTKNLTFHDAGRASGATWMALRGDDPLRIQRRLGHSDFATTQIYIREAESLGRDVGEPFPELPDALLAAAESLTDSLVAPAVLTYPSDTTKKVQRGGRDSNAHGPERSQELAAVSSETASESPTKADPPRANPRAALLADLAGRLAELTAAGDVAAAMEVHALIGRMLGGSTTNVVPISSAKRR